MKRFFALALVLVMALSMMALGASAASACTHNAVLYCTNPNHTLHYYVFEVVDGVTSYCMFNNDGHSGEYSPGMSVQLSISVLGVEFAQGRWIGYNPSTRFAEYCPNTPPAPQPQPKTGVEDTLPLWFGVMAVSAAAYVMTSKKKVF